jgi:hypothetical protein
MEALNMEEKCDLLGIHTCPGIKVVCKTDKTQFEYELKMKNAR